MSRRREEDRRRPPQSRDLGTAGATAATDNCSTPTRLAPQIKGVDVTITTFFDGKTDVTFRFVDGAVSSPAAFQFDGRFIGDVWWVLFSWRTYAAH